MTKITVKVNGLEALADGLSRVTGQRLGRSALEAVNEVTVRVERQAVEGELANINLTTAYVKSKTDVSLGSNPASPRGEIVTSGDLTVLGRFPGTVWYRQPGAPRRAGPVKGRRSAGVFANITNTERINQPQWFVMRLKNQSTLTGAFVRDDAIAPKNDRGPGLGDAGRRRDGKAGKKHIYGPSPYQLFRRQIDVQTGRWQDDLDQTVTSALVRAIEESLP